MDSVLHKTTVCEQVVQNKGFFNETALNKLLCSIGEKKSFMKMKRGFSAGEADTFPGLL